MDTHVDRRYRKRRSQADRVSKTEREARGCDRQGERKIRRKEREEGETATRRATANADAETHRYRHTKR